MAHLGAFTFVLHSHLPYCRRAGRWPHGEEWIHEAAAETYIPLLDALYDLLQDGVRPRLTVGITPILTEQLADKDIADHFEEYLLEKIAAAEKDIVRLEAIDAGANAAAAQAAADEVEAERVADLDTPVGERVSEALDEPAALAAAAATPTSYKSWTNSIRSRRRRRPRNSPTPTGSTSPAGTTTGTAASCARSPSATTAISSAHSNGSRTRAWSS
jgi:hypothetical protein